MKKNIKILLPLSLSIISTISLVSWSISDFLIEKYESTSFKANKIGWTRKDEADNMARYGKDALTEDVTEKANTDSVLFYKITGIAIITKFSFISHIMKILDSNPDKDIRVYTILKTGEKGNFNDTYFYQKDELGNRKFPNIEFRYFDETLVEVATKFDFHKEFLSEVQAEFPNRKIDGYFDDDSFMKKILLYVNYANSPYDRLVIYEEFAPFAKLNSTNFFSDGTKSVEYYDQKIKDAFLIANNVYDGINYSNAKKIREDVKNNNISKKKFIEGNNAILFLTSLVTMDFTNPTKTKYFQTTTDFIDEINRVGAKNYKNGENDIFSPFNSLNANIISFLRTINLPEIQKILKINPNFNPNSYINNMNGKINYVFAGTEMISQERIDGNAKILLSIKRFAEKEKPVDDKREIVVWFKGHPRDWNRDALIKLKTAVKKITNGKDNGNWINELDHQVPFEFYAISNVFESSVANNKEVYIFSAYSTLVMLMYADNKINQIVKIIVDNKSLVPYTVILNLYGINSKIFPNEKLITLEEFQAQNK